jgi:regulator of sigma D
MGNKSDFNEKDLEEFCQALFDDYDAYNGVFTEPITKELAENPEFWKSMKKDYWEE